MQNYQNFIDELFQLKIETVQYFVANGQVLYDQLPQHYTAEQLANTPANRLPGYLATFMSLDQYDYHRTQNRYADILNDLQRRAKKDLLLLEPAQVNRLLADAKSEKERLIQLLESATEYQKAWDNGTLDQLPSLFLELRILNAFTIPIRPEASPHKRFAHHLHDAIMYKYGTLSGFMKQIEAITQPIPAIANKAAQGPEYDLEQINTDGIYAFAKLKELAIYLPTIQPFTKRVEWFFKTSRIWKIEPRGMGIGSRMIPDREVYSRTTDDGKPVDENGQRVEEVAWGLSYSNVQEKAILHRLYFLRFYRTHSANFLNKPRLDFDQLTDKYTTQVHTERGKRFVLEWVTGEIRDRQQLINDWITANSDRYGTPEIKRQLQNAAVLIEQELEGIPAIKWELFYRTMHLDPFALLWGLVEYKRYLEIEQLTAPADPTPPDNSETTEIVMSNRFTSETRNHYDKAHQDASYLKRLDEYDLNRVSEYAQERWGTHLDFAYRMMSANPEPEKYPVQYQNGREMEYWLEREYQTQKCKVVIQEIERIRALQAQPLTLIQTLTPPPATDQHTGFDTYIKEEHRAKLMPYLIANYNGLEPRFYAYMIGALIRLEITPESTRHSNKSAVYRALNQSFKTVFRLQSWNAAINRLDSENNDEDRREVNARYELIKGLLKL